jgi:hypothetical protein
MKKVILFIINLLVLFGVGQIVGVVISILTAIFNLSSLAALPVMGAAVWLLIKISSKIRTAELTKFETVIWTFGTLAGWILLVADIL